MNKLLVCLFNFFQIVALPIKLLKITPEKNNYAMLTEKINIIVAEDDMDDKLLLQDAFSDNNIDESIVRFASDGEELIRMVRNGVSLPTIIILDLNMPKKDGRETLREIKNDENLKHIPILILTTSSSENDIAMSYKEGSNTFFTKPGLYSDLVDVIGSIKKYWLEKALLVV